MNTNLIKEIKIDGSILKVKASTDPLTRKLRGTLSLAGLSLSVYSCWMAVNLVCLCGHPTAMSN